MRKVQACLGHHDVLDVGDSKMAALATRTYVAASQDHYLCPLPTVQMPAAELRVLLAPVWTGQQVLTPINRACEATPDKPEHIADGFTNTQIGRRRVGKECLRLCRSRWSPYH